MNYLDKHINLLWTGGWDSTFQLLQSVLVNNSVVQPYYIIDPNRRSMIREIMAIRSIKESLFKKFPETRELILPIVFKMVDDILIDPAISEAFINYKKEKHIGLQYLWLASFCKEIGINNMQLSVEKSLVPDPNLWDANLEGKLIMEYSDNQILRKMDPKYNHLKEYTLFQYFAFPLIETTKKDMLQIAKEKKWLSILDKSWFCLFPTNKNKPCGICKPCSQTLTEGFSYRMPKNRIRYASYVQNIELPTKRILKKFLFLVGIKINLKWKLFLKQSPQNPVVHHPYTRQQTDLRL